MSWRELLAREAERAPFGTALYVRDVASGEAFEHRADERVSAASMIKLFVLWELFRANEAGEIDINETVTLGPGVAVDGGMLHAVTPGAALRLDDLALLMMCVSDNTAANLLIDRLGMERIGQTIGEFGAGGTVLGRKMLDFEAKKRGLENYTTARDVAHVLEKICAKGGRMLEILSIQKNISKLPAMLPFEDTDDLEAIIAHKTGELPGHEHDGGIFFHRSERPVIAVAMTSGIPHRAAGCDFCARVGRIVHEAFSAPRS